MLWIHSSFSSGVGAEMRYTMWFPSTTRPSASVLHALISWPRLLGMYSSKQFLGGEQRSITWATAWTHAVMTRPYILQQCETYRLSGVLYLPDAEVFQGNDTSWFLILLEKHRLIILCLYIESSKSATQLPFRQCAFLPMFPRGPCDSETLLHFSAR